MGVEGAGSKKVREVGDLLSYLTAEGEIAFTGGGGGAMNPNSEHNRRTNHSRWFACGVLRGGSPGHRRSDADTM